VSQVTFLGSLAVLELCHCSYKGRGKIRFKETSLPPLGIVLNRRSCHLTEVTNGCLSPEVLEAFHVLLTLYLEN
jgi:hypothetical protein